MKRMASPRSLASLRCVLGIAGILTLSACSGSSSNTPSGKSQNTAPSQRFDLLGWMLNVPVDNDGNGKADSIKEKNLNSGYYHPDFFYLNQDDGIVFKAPISGVKTSKNASHTRTELREMMRRGDTKIKTKGVNSNNWVTSTAPPGDQQLSGGVDGILDATLAVNHVTTTGDAKEVGRVVIGQVEGPDSKLVRIYYRKLPNNEKGSVYFIHEPTTGEDIYYELIGSKSSNAKDPADGIRLDEVFSYRIDVSGNFLTVTITRPGKADALASVDMSYSGYDQDEQSLYFRAGAYNLNRTGEPNDFVQVTFYDLEANHSKTIFK